MSALPNEFIKGADGRTQWVAAVIRDVTERYLREKTLRAHLEAAQDGATDNEETRKPT